MDDISELKHEIASLRQELRQEMGIVEQSLTIKLGTIAVVAIGAVAAIVKLIHG